MFSAPIPPSISAALLVAIDEIQDKERRKKMWDNVCYLRGKLSKTNFIVLNSETPIIPILLGKESDCINTSRKLLKRGIYAPCYRYPAVEKNKARLRLTITSNHTFNLIDVLISALLDIKKGSN